MGLKSGSRDAGFDESEEGEAEREEQSSGQESAETSAESTETERSDSGTTDTDPGTTTSAETETNTGSPTDRPTMNSIPYKLRREKVNEGREQVPYFLREEVIDAEEELQDTLEGLLDETVYKSDYREASMIVAQRNPELIAEVLREWGYDLEMA